MRKYMLLLSAIVVTASSVLGPVTAAGAVAKLSDVDVSRYGGADRYATSLRIAEAVAMDAGGSLDWVVMVSGHNWTDAVVAAPLAGSLGAPVLTTPSGELRSDAAEFLRTTGVSNALIVGADSDTDGVGPTVVSELEALGISVERVTRADQYATSVAAARRLGTPGDMRGHGRTAIVASGEVFADALVAGAFAARGQHPILLTKPHVLRQDVARYLTDTGIEHVVLMGGTAALREAIEESIAALGIAVTRLAGDTRYDTAVAAAKLATHRYSLTCFTARRVGLARARVPFDSFSAAPLLARLCSPLLLADPDSIPSSTAAYLDQLRADIAPSGDDTLAAHVFGGNAAISETAIEDYLSGAISDVTCALELGDEPVSVLGEISASDASWSPDCSRIAHSSGGRIWTANVDGTNRVQVTKNTPMDFAGDSEPEWSPDGTQIVFSRYLDVWIHDDEPLAHIIVVNADGVGEKQLTDAKGTDRHPRWSPDGRRIVFQRRDLEGDPDDPDSGWKKTRVMVIDADGRNETRVIQGDGGGEIYASWTPDGQRISYPNGGRGLGTVRDDGTDWKPVWPVSRADLWFSEYAWSPDGCRIALVTRETLEDGRRVEAIKVINLEDSAITTVVSYTGPNDGYTVIDNPVWSPDGRSILYGTRVSNTGALLGSFVARVPEQPDSETAG